MIGQHIAYKWMMNEAEFYLSIDKGIYLLSMLEKPIKPYRLMLLNHQSLSLFPSSIAISSFIDVSLMLSMFFL